MQRLVRLTNVGGDLTFATALSLAIRQKKKIPEQEDKLKSSDSYDNIL